jgi:peroxiredoxin
MLFRTAVLGIGLLASTSCATPEAGRSAIFGRPLAVEARPVALPALDLVTLDGRVMNLQTALGGRVALVALWATWCKTCKGELAALSRLSERAGPQGATVLGVAVGETRDTVAEFVARRSLPYPQLVDEKFRLAEAIGQDSIPTTLVLDRQGRITYVGGVLDERALAALRAAIDRPIAME